MRINNYINATLLTIASLGFTIPTIAQEPPTVEGGGSSGLENSTVDPFGARPAGGSPFGAGAADPFGPQRINFDGILRVTYEVSVDGVVLKSKSMAGLIISTKPFAIATCESIMSGGDRKSRVEIPKEASSVFRLERLRSSQYHDDPFGSGSELPLPEIYIAHQPYTVASGFVFVTAHGVASTQLGLKQVDLVRSNKPGVVSSGYFHVIESAFPVPLTKSSSPNVDGLFSASESGLESYVCNREPMTRSDILKAFLEARKLQKGLGDGGGQFNQPPKTATTNSASVAPELFPKEDSRPAASTSSEQMAFSKNYEAQAILNSMVPIIVRIKQSADDAQK